MRKFHGLWLMLAIIAVAAGCSSTTEVKVTQPPQDMQEKTIPTVIPSLLPPTLIPAVASPVKQNEQPRELYLSSPVIEPAGAILPQYTCSAGDISPPLDWDGAPAETKSLALIVEDVDAPGGIFVHWVLFNIPADRKHLPQGVPTDETVEGIGVQGVNDAGKTGYTGPCPPPGSPHRYFFRLYALDTRLFLPAGTQKSDLEKGMEGHILAQAEFFATYQSQAQNSDE